MITKQEAIALAMAEVVSGLSKVAAAEQVAVAVWEAMRESMSWFRCTIEVRHPGFQGGWIGRRVLSLPSRMLCETATAFRFGSGEDSLVIHNLGVYDPADVKEGLGTVSENGWQWDVERCCVLACVSTWRVQLAKPKWERIGSEADAKFGGDYAAGANWCARFLQRAGFEIPANLPCAQETETA